MIESEIAILNLVSHSHIIELIEVFDFPDEKYLVTELVPGGDLFDAIASDVRYRYVGKHYIYNSVYIMFNKTSEAY